SRSDRRVEPRWWWIDDDGGAGTGGQPTIGSRRCPTGGRRPDRDAEVGPPRGRPIRPPGHLGVGVGLVLALTTFLATLQWSAAARGHAPEGEPRASPACIASSMAVHVSPSSTRSVFLSRATPSAGYVPRTASM